MKDALVMKYIELRNDGKRNAELGYAELARACSDRAIGVIDAAEALGIEMDDFIIAVKIKRRELMMKEMT